MQSGFDFVFAFEFFSFAIPQKRQGLACRTAKPQPILINQVSLTDFRKLTQTSIFVSDELENKPIVFSCCQIFAAKHILVSITLDKVHLDGGRIDLCVTLTTVVIETLVARIGK